MTATVEKRRALLINVAYFSLIIGAFYLFMRFAFWPLFPFIFAFFVAMLFQKPLRALTKRIPVKRGFAALLMTTFTALMLIGIIALAGTSVVSEIKGVIDTLMQTFENIPDFINQAEAWLLNLVDKLPQAIGAPLAVSVSDLADSLMTAFKEGSANELPPTGTNLLGLDFSALLKPLSGVISKAGKVPSILIAIVITFIATCFITADYDRIVRFIKRQFPAKKRETLSKTKALTMSTLSKMCKAYCLIICITCTELIIGLYALKLIGVYGGSYIFTIAIATAVVDIMPILGSGTVLIPWGIGSLLMGNIGLGIGILVLYVIISVLRQYIEPKLVAGQLGLPPIATLMSMYLGLKIFGVLGMFILPITITILKVLNDDGIIHIWRTSRSVANSGDAAHSSIELKKLSLKKKQRKEKKK